MKHAPCEHNNLKSKCRECNNLKQKEWKEKNKEKVLENSKLQRYKRLNNPISKKICKTHEIISKDKIDKWHRCIECRREMNKKSYDNNKDRWESKKYENSGKLYTQEKRREYRLRYQQKYGEKFLERRRNNQKKYISSLTDGHVKFTISRKYGMDRKTIPEELIPIEREIQKIKRKAKEINQ